VLLGQVRALLSRTTSQKRTHTNRPTFLTPQLRTSVQTHAHVLLRNLEHPRTSGAEQTVLRAHTACSTACCASLSVLSPASSDGPTFGIADDDDDTPSGLAEVTMDTVGFGSSSDSDEEVSGYHGRGTFLGLLMRLGGCGIDAVLMHSMSRRRLAQLALGSPPTGPQLTKRNPSPPPVPTRW
jgi:hypothetical protein